MDKELYTKWRWMTTHPPDDEILSCLDGELNSSKAARIRTHLKHCWHCRLRFQEIERSIVKFMKHRQSVLAQPDNLPPGGWRSFEPRLDQLAETEHRQLPSSVFSLLARGPSPSAVLRLALLSVFCCLVYLWYYSDSAKTVSAKEVLQRARASELERLSTVPDPVVYQKLRVRHWQPSIDLERVATVELWSNAAGKRLQKESDEVEMWEELEDILLANRMGSKAPLSPVAYSSWRASVDVTDEEIIPTTLAGGTEALILKTFAPTRLARRSIMEVSLVVRTTDWHPVVQRLRVAAENNDFLEYELTEVESRVISERNLGVPLVPGHWIKSSRSLHPANHARV